MLLFTLLFLQALALVVIVSSGVSAACIDHGDEVTCYRNDTCVWDSDGEQCVGVSVWCPNRITKDECHRGSECVFVQDTGACVFRDQSIPNYARCEAHHGANALVPTSSGHPTLQLVQACVNDSLCDWDGYRGRCVPLRNVTCAATQLQTNATHCRARAGCYWYPSAAAGARCRPFSWDGETKCAARDNTNTSYCGALGMHSDSCVYDTQTLRCDAPLHRKPLHTSYAWRAFCVHSGATPLTASANASECVGNDDRRAHCSVTWDPLAIDECTPAGSWCSTLQTEAWCDLYSYCYFAAGDYSAQAPYPVISSPAGPYARGCFARNPELGTDGWRDDWGPFVSDVWVVMTDTDSLFVRLEASIVVPQATRDDGDPQQLRLWDVYIPSSNASTPNHLESSQSGALGHVWGNVSAPLSYPLAAAVRTALRQPTSASPIAMNLHPYLYTFTGRQFETAHEFEGRNTMAVRVSASIPRAELRNVVHRAHAQSYYAFTWNVSVHAVNESSTLARVWQVRSVVTQTTGLASAQHQAHSVMSVDDDVGTTSVAWTPIAAVSPSVSVSGEPGADDATTQWLDFQVHKPNASVALTAPVVLRDVSEASTSPVSVTTSVRTPTALDTSRHLDWLRLQSQGGNPYHNATTETGFTTWLRRSIVPNQAVVDLFHHFTFPERIHKSARGVSVPWIDTTQTHGVGIQMLIEKRLRWQHSLAEPWYALSTSLRASIAQTLSSTICLEVVNSTGHLIAGPLGLENTQSVTTLEAAPNTAPVAVVWSDQYPAEQPPEAWANTSLYTYWWDKLNELSRVALGEARDAVHVVSVDSSEQNRTVYVNINTTALSYWIVPWFAERGLAKCLDCAYYISYVVEFPTPIALNVSWSASSEPWLDWDGVTNLTQGGAGRLRYMHRQIATVHDDLLALVTTAEALTKQRVSHSAAVWAVVIWLCAVVFIIGVLLLSRGPDFQLPTMADEMRARLILADKQMRDARKAADDARHLREATNPFNDANVVDIQDGGAPPAAVIDESDDAAPSSSRPASMPSPAPERADRGIRQRLVNAMNPSGRLTARLTKS